MKKSILVFAAICTIVLTFTSMGKNKLTSVKGHINYYGNAPFEEPGFKTDSGEILAMSVAPEATFTLEDVLKLNGYYVQLDGTLEKNDLSTQPIGARQKIVIHAYQDVSMREAKK